MFVKEEEGKVFIKTTENVAPILDAVKDQRDMYAEMPRLKERAGRYVGTIPGTLAAQWALECKSAPGTKEFLEYAKKKLLSGNYSKLIVEGY